MQAPKEKRNEPMTKKRKMISDDAHIPVPQSPPLPSESPSEPTFAEFLRNVDFTKIKTGEELCNSEIFKERWQQTKQWYQQQNFKF